MGDVTATLRQYPWVASITLFRASRCGDFNSVRLQGRKMSRMAGRTTMGMRATFFVMVEIQGNSSLNRRKTH
jgi:hypothetical protein